MKIRTFKFDVDDEVYTYSCGHVIVERVCSLCEGRGCVMLPAAGADKKYICPECKAHGSRYADGIKYEPRTLPGHIIRISFAMDSDGERCAYELDSGAIREESELFASLYDCRVYCDHKNALEAIKREKRRLEEEQNES